MAPTSKKAVKKVTLEMSDEDLESMLDEIHEAGDEGATLLGGDGLALKIRGVISTQCPALDDAIGRGGVPLGRLSILHGPEASGKTTCALHLVAETQRVGGVALYMDKEYKLDPDYAKKIGVDTKRLIISQPNHLEAAFAVMRKVIEKAAEWRERSGRRVPILIVLDSMNAAITKAQFEGEFTDKHMAPQARCYSENLPKLMPQVFKEDVALVWISQVRQKMNVQYGDDQEIAGGKGPRFYASLIINFKRIGSIKQGDEKVGNKTLAECKKNQIAPPFKKAEFAITYGRGFDAEMSLVDLAIAKKVLEKRGAWLYLADEGEKLAAGVIKAAELLRERSDIAKLIAEKAGVPWTRE